MPAAFTMKGLRELKILAARSSKELNRDVNKALRFVAEEIRADAGGLAAASITRIGPNWSRMRVGVTRKVVYVAPRQRGTRGRTAKSRPRFADLMEQRAMGPALERNKANVEARVEDALEGLAAKWNRSG